MQDLIGQLLASVRLRARVFYRGQHCGRWLLSVPGTAQAMLHFVVQGRCLIDTPDHAETMPLSNGDLVVFTRASAHVIRAREDAPDRGEDAQFFAFEEGWRADATGLICCHLEFDPNVRNPLLEALPECVVVPAESHPDRDWLTNMLALLLSESSAAAPATESVIEHLADILFIHVLRSYLASSPERTGVLAAYTDRALRAALEVMHDEPPRPLTIADLACAANLSRSAFFERFTRVLGMPPMVYLTQQHLESAYRQLREGSAKVLEIALACGYESEASFSKAFKRMYGIAPGALRRGKG